MNPAHSSPRLRVLATLLAVTLAATLIGLALGPAPAAAAQCKGGSVPGHKLAPKRAGKATLCLINKQRRARGLSSLKHSGQARRAASSHSAEMVRRRCFSHICPGERDLLGRLSKSNYLPCNCSWGVAENIAYGYGGESSPRMIVAAWMGSPPHRANILNRAYEHIGVGVRRGSPAGGGSAATYTADFGYRN